MSVDFPSSTLPAVEMRSRGSSSSCAVKWLSARARGSAVVAILEVALPLLQFHRAFLVVIDHAVFSFGPAEGGEFVNDLADGVRL